MSSVHQIVEVGIAGCKYKHPLIKVHPPCLFPARIEIHPGPPKKVQIEVHPPFCLENEGEKKTEIFLTSARIEVHL